MMKLRKHMKMCQNGMRKSTTPISQSDYGSPQIEPSPFKDKYIKNLLNIVNTYPTPLIMNRKATAILKGFQKEIKIKKENKFYQTVCEVLL